MSTRHKLTESVKLCLRKKDATLINVPSCKTCRIQPSDVCISKTLKCYITGQFEKQLQENINLFVQSKLPGSDKRCLYY